ncbi:hypothetical protein JMUB6875_72800 [Nocardia sp. JMUB6875]|uniref:hypothetical protein n=1 Tax=Nocardia sp. JMUB6875 TaxID=3158170 RepID=UPI0032E70769
MSNPKDDQQPQGPADQATQPAAGTEDTSAPADAKNSADQSAAKGDAPEGGKDSAPGKSDAAPGKPPADAAPPTAATEVIPSANSRTEEIRTGAPKPAKSGPAGFATIRYEEPKPARPARLGSS